MASEPKGLSEEMIDAGARAHDAWTGDEKTIGSINARRNAAEIYRAMQAARAGLGLLLEPTPPIETGEAEPKATANEQKSTRPLQPRAEGQ